MVVPDEAMAVAQRSSEVGLTWERGSHGVTREREQCCLVCKWVALCDVVMQVSGRAGRPRHLARREGIHTRHPDSPQILRIPVTTGGMRRRVPPHLPHLHTPDTPLFATYEDDRRRTMLRSRPVSPTLSPTRRPPNL